MPLTARPRRGSPCGPRAAPDRGRLCLIDTRSPHRPWRSCGRWLLPRVTAPCGPGARYRYLLDGDGRPAPTRRRGPARRRARAVGGRRSSSLSLGRRRLRPDPLCATVIYEVHVGTFTAGGHVRRRHRRARRLVELGDHAVELMPVAQFPGRRNWGYDGVFPFAVQNSYGGPAGLQRFVDACHAARPRRRPRRRLQPPRPRGQRARCLRPLLHRPLPHAVGAGRQLRRPGSDEVPGVLRPQRPPVVRRFPRRRLRLDAVHEIIDRTAMPFLAELARGRGPRRGRLRPPRVPDRRERGQQPAGRHPRSGRGLGMDAQWNDDFHHAVHAALTGETGRLLRRLRDASRTSPRHGPGLRLPG